MQSNFRLWSKPLLVFYSSSLYITPHPNFHPSYHGLSKFKVLVTQQQTRMLHRFNSSCINPTFFIFLSLSSTIKLFLFGTHPPKWTAVSEWITNITVCGLICGGLNEKGKKVTLLIAKFHASECFKGSRSFHCEREWKLFFFDRTMNFTTVELDLFNCSVGHRSSKYHCIHIQYSFQEVSNRSAIKNICLSGTRIFFPAF